MNLFESVYHSHKYHFLLLDSFKYKDLYLQLLYNRGFRNGNLFSAFLTSTGNKACAAFTFLVGEEGVHNTKFPTRLNSSNSLEVRK